MVELQVISDDYRCKIEMERRITYLRGDSGVGKSTLVDYILLGNSAGDAVKVTCNKHLAVIQDIDSNSRVVNEKDTLFILDDPLVIEDEKWFSEAIIKDLIKNDSYMLIISRVDFPNLNNNIEFSINSVLTMKADGIEHYCVPFTDNFTCTCKVDMSKYDCIITEDTHGMHEFAKSWLNNNVISTNGKGNVIKVIKNLPESYKRVFLFVDSAAFGQKIHELQEVAMAVGIIVVLDNRYECFEYFVLLTNWFNTRLNFSVEEANKFVSWEKYFETELEKITANSFVKYLHGKKLRSCYTVECDNCTECSKQKKEKCKYYLKNKLVDLVKGTRFEYMLNTINQ